MSLPSPRELKTALKAPAGLQKSLKTYQKTLGEILEGKSPLFALVVGPCSIHDPSSALEYARRLKSLSDRVKSTCFLVMRAHIEKPRTTTGWKGLLYDPFLNESQGIDRGLYVCRKLFLDIAELGVPMATEFLEPLVAPYFSDLISWGFIGARTSSSQIHRQLASSLDLPIGFKNSTDGDLLCAIDGAKAASARHRFIHVNDHGLLSEISSAGNRSTHIVLRGSMQSPNYSPLDIQKAQMLLEERGLSPRLLVDAAHGNSHKIADNQKDVCYNVLDQHLGGNRGIIGLMIESYLEEGTQPISEEVNPRKSVTDPCINWRETEDLILSMHESLLHSSVACTV